MKKLFIFASILFIFCAFGSCFAIDDFTVQETNLNTDSSALEMIITDNRPSGQSPTSVAVSVDNTQMTDVSLKLISDSDLPISFVFVVDNTSTAISNQKKRPAEIAQAIRETRNNNQDRYYLIGYDTVVHSPQGPSAYPDDLFSSLSYGVVGMSDYTEALMKAVDLLKNDNVYSKKVIILISDGNLTNSPKVQTGELMDVLAESPYPVYICGMAQSESDSYVQADLQKLENISKATGGLYISDESNRTQGKDFLNHMLKTLIIEITFPAEYSGNSEGTGNAAIQLSRDNREIALINTLVPLPKTEIETITAETETPVSTEEDPCADEDNPDCVEPEISEEAANPLREYLGEQWALILTGVALVIVVLVVVIVINSAKNRKKADFEEMPVEPEEETKPAKDEATDRVTEETPNSDATVIIGDREVRPQRPKMAAKIVLDDLTNRRQITTVIADGESKVFGRFDPKAPNNGVVVITKNDGHISRSQFMITLSGTRLVIKDMGSINKTYLNGDQINGEMVLKNNSRVRIGNVTGEREFAVSISKA